MDLGRSLDQVLEVCPIYHIPLVSAQRFSREKEGDKPRQEISEVNKLAVCLVFNVDDSPTVLASTDRLAVDDDVAFRTDNSERDHVLLIQEMRFMGNFDR